MNRDLNLSEKSNERNNSKINGTVTDDHDNALNNNEKIKTDLVNSILTRLDSENILASNDRNSSLIQNIQFKTNTSTDSIPLYDNKTAINAVRR